MGMFDWLSPTAGSDQGGMGLMGMLANPQTAGLLGMAGGLLQASGPSRLPVSNGMALGSGFQGMQQNMGNALQMQRTMAALNAIQGGMPGTQGQGVPPTQSLPAVTGGANVASLSGPSAGMGQFAPPTPVSVQSAQQQAAAAAQTPFEAQFGMTPEQMYQRGNGYAMLGFPNGTKMMEIAAQYNPALASSMPTDATKMGTQAGLTQQQIQQANADALRKANYIAPTALRTPIYFDPTTGTTKVVDPAQLAAGYGAQYGAEARAQAGFKPMQVWDPSANGGQGGFVFQTAANVSDAASGGQAPVGIRNNNFGNIKGANGQFQTFDTPQDGVNAADQLLATYGSKYGINTITGIANRWAPAGDGNNNPNAKAAAMAAASGVPANQPINLADPATRARILPALFDTETPGWRNALGGANSGNAQNAPAQRSGPMAAAPPIGTQTAVENTAKDNSGNYNNLTQFASASPDRVNTLDNMMELAQGNTKFGPGWEGRLDRMAQINSYLPSGMAFGSDNAANAQTFQKYASYLVQQYQRAMGGHQTDAQLNTVIHGTPNPEMLNQTMTEVIPKLKAMELAVQAKATAADNWMAQHGNNASNYNQFESAWRQNYDPRIYQMQQMDLPTRAAFMKSQPDANALRGKVATALQNGWVQ